MMARKMLCMIGNRFLSSGMGYSGFYTGKVCMFDTWILVRMIGDTAFSMVLITDSTHVGGFVVERPNLDRL